MTRSGPFPPVNPASLEKYRFIYLHNNIQDFSYIAIAYTFWRPFLQGIYYEIRSGNCTRTQMRLFLTRLCLR